MILSKPLDRNISTAFGIALSRLLSIVTERILKVEKTQMKIHLETHLDRHLELEAAYGVGLYLRKGTPLEALLQAQLEAETVVHMYDPTSGGRGE